MPKTYSIQLDDDKFTGSALDIVTAMREQSFFASDVPLDEYMSNFIPALDHLTGSSFTITGDTLEAKAESFVEGLLSIGSAKDINLA